jgi:hypothetical protein
MSQNTPAFVHTTVHELVKRIEDSNPSMRIEPIVPRLSIAKAMYSLLKREIDSRNRIADANNQTIQLEIGCLVRDSGERYFTMLSTLPREKYHDARIEIMPDVKSLQVMLAAPDGEWRGKDGPLRTAPGTIVADIPQDALDAAQARVVSDVVSWAINNRVHRIYTPTAIGDVVAINDDEEIDASIIMREGAKLPTSIVFATIRSAIEKELQVHNICASTSYSISGESCFAYRLVPSDSRMKDVVVLTDDIEMCLMGIRDFRITDYDTVDSLARAIIELLPDEFSDAEEPQQKPNLAVSIDLEEEVMGSELKVSDIKITSEQKSISCTPEPVEQKSVSSSPVSVEQKRPKLSAAASSFVPLPPVAMLSASAAPFTPRPSQAGTTVAAGAPLLKVGFGAQPSSYLGAVQMYNPPMMMAPAIFPQHYKQYNPYLQAQSIPPFHMVPLPSPQAQYHR